MGSKAAAKACHRSGGGSRSSGWRSPVASSGLTRWLSNVGGKITAYLPATVSLYCDSIADQCDADSLEN